MLDIKNVTAGYGATPVLRDVSLEVDSGEVVGIIGRNGVGKTTLIKTVIGLLDVDSGSIEFRGEDITNTEANERARKGIGYIPQGRDVFPGMTVQQNLKMGELISEHKSSDLHELVYQYFPRLDERRTQKAGTMSGGEQQMLAIGRALVGDPELLLLDEPSEGIQPSLVTEIAENILDINEELDTTVLFVEQNLEFVQKISDRCYSVDNGEIVAKLDRSDIEDETILRGYLSI